MSKFIPKGMGWIPDLPDPRDYTYEHEAVLPLLQRLKPARTKKLAEEVDLRADDEGIYITPPHNQGPLHCSSACAVLSLVEYFERRINGRTFEGSNLFLYKVTRNHLEKGRHARCNCGADLRTTLKVLTSIGTPAEEYWPFQHDKFTKEPSQFVYTIARPMSRIRYFRIDKPSHDGTRIWNILRSFLTAGFPVLFGFSVPTSLSRAAEIAYRPGLDAVRGGQAVLAVGYDRHRFGHKRDAILIRSSWGSEWGDNGNGWLPREFVVNDLCCNFWTAVSDDWTETVELTCPSVVTATMT